MVVKRKKLNTFRVEVFPTKRSKRLGIGLIRATTIARARVVALKKIKREKVRAVAFSVNPHFADLVKRRKK